MGDNEEEQNRKIFIGGLDERTSDEDLHSYFCQFGQINDVVVMRTRGFGFVTFADSRSIYDCLNIDQHWIHGRVVDVKRAQPEGAMPAKKQNYGEPEQLRKLFIGGLDYNTTAETLSRYFGQYGDIVDSVVMKHPMTKQSRGFGFVCYSSSRMVDEALKHAPHQLDGRNVDAKKAVASPTADENGTPHHLRKLFIGGLDYSTSDDSLRKYFLQWGDLEDVIVMKNSENGSRGFGFVTYTDSNMADTVLKTRPHLVDGRTVDVKRVVPRTEIGKLESSVSVKKVFVGGIGSDVTEDDLRETFGQFGSIVLVSIPLDKDSNKQRGFAFVEFEDYDSLDKAVLHKNITVKGQRVEVKKALRSDQLQALGQGSYRGNPGGGPPSGFGNQGGNNQGWNNQGNPNNNWGGQGGNQGWGNQGGPGGGNWGGPQGGSGGNQGWNNRGGPGNNQGWGNNGQGGWGGNQGGPGGPGDNHAGWCNRGGNQGGWGGNSNNQNCGGGEGGGWGGQQNNRGGGGGGWGNNQGGGGSGSGGSWQSGTVDKSSGQMGNNYGSGPNSGKAGGPGGNYGTSSADLSQGGPGNNSGPGRGYGGERWGQDTKEFGDNYQQSYGGPVRAQGAGQTTRSVPYNGTGKGFRF